jgi:hypothetical protein
MASSPISSLKGIDSTLISTGATGLTPVIDLTGRTLTAIGMSTAWTAGVMTFQASTGSTATFRNVYGSTGNELTLTTTANRHVAVDSNLFRSIRFLKIRSGTGATPVVQATARTLSVFSDALSAIK